MTGIQATEAIRLLEAVGRDAFDLFHRAGDLRLERRGKRVVLCRVLNAKSGACAEDCAFCAQSSHAKAAVERYPLVDADRIVDAARDAAARGAHRFGIVTSGRGVHETGEIETIARAVEAIAGAIPLESCVSLGLVAGETLRRLRDAGLTRYHHNLETSASFFPEICTTRRYEDSVETVRAARDIGLKTCSGGIFGLGESRAQRVELLEALRELDVDSVPLNFLNPIPGTRLEGMKTLEPLECLKIIAVARLMMPDKDIRVCGGREVSLRDLQSWALLAGAEGLMVGGYLTTPGRSVDEDLRMIADAGFEVHEGHEEFSTTKDTKTTKGKP